MTGPTSPPARGPVVVGVTGASGVIYARRLIGCLRERGIDIFLCVTDVARRIIADECPDPDGWIPSDATRIRHVAPDDFGAPFCSGSFRFRGMVIVPASMGTVGAIASGVSTNCIHRGADVAIKEKRPLVVVPREMPFSTIHLRHLLTLAEAGAVVMPPSPGFYGRPKHVADLVDFVVSRILDTLGLDHDLGPRWDVTDASPREATP